MIHQDDLSELILRAAEKGSLVGGSIFDAANDASESTDDFLEKLIRVSGAQGGYTYLEPSNGRWSFSYKVFKLLILFAVAYEEALQTTSLIRPYLGRTLLDWRPRKASLVDGLETYYASWKASEAL